MKDESTQATVPKTSGVAPLEQYANNLLIERGTLELDPGLVEAMKGDLLDRLERLSTQTMLAALTDTDREEFEKMVDAGASPEELQAFASQKVPDLSDRLTEALIRFRQVYLGSAAA